LLAHHRRYLAATFDATTVPLAEKRLSTEMADPTTTQWIISEAQIRLASYRQYEELMHTRAHVYDAGGLIVLDLAAPTQTAAPTR